MLRRHKHFGIGLLELMLSLAVIAVLLLLATRYYLVTERSERVAKGATMISNIVAATAKYAEGVTDLKKGKLSIQSLIDTHLLSEAYRSSPWAKPGVTDVKILPTGNDFTIYMANIPPTECTNLLDTLKKDHPDLIQKCTSMPQSPYATYQITDSFAQ